MSVLATYVAKQLAVTEDGQLVATFLRLEGQGTELILMLIDAQDDVTLGETYSLSLDKQIVPEPVAPPAPFPVPSAAPYKTPYLVPDLVPQAVPGAVPGYAYRVPVAPVATEQREPYKVPETPVPAPMLVPQLVPYMTPEQVAQVPGLVPMKVPVPNPEVPEAIPYIWPEQSSAVPVAWVVPPMNVPPLPYVVPPPIVNPQSTPMRVPGRVDQDPDVGHIVAPALPEKDRVEVLGEKDENPGEKDVPTQSK
jgi:hypothetical protein